MLVSLIIRNVVLIESLTVNFRTGFCALTGETGAGKSILLDSLALALGMRAESGLVRKGEAQATVTASFEVAADHPVKSLLADQGLVLEDGLLILRRVLGADGRSRAFINDQPVSVGLLRQAGDMLVEIHGQFETHGLLDPRTHGGLLDEYAGIDTARIAVLWDAWRTAEQALAHSRAAMEKARAEESYLRMAIEDLDALTPQAGEEEKLAQLRDRLMRRGQSLENLQGAESGLSHVDETLAKVWRLLERVGEDAQPLRDGLDRAMAEVQDVIAGVHSLSADMEDSEYSLPEIDDRLHALRAQARKHGCAVDELAAKQDELSQQLMLIERQDEKLDELNKAVALARHAYIEGAQQAAVARRKAAEQLDGLVAAELPPLKLEKARFVTAVEDMPESAWGPGGVDRVRFLVATNPGAEPGALDRIASGGEMARFMLALKVVMAAVGVAGTYIFDEVDSGIGGPTAAAVGERLARLSETRQVLVVTHAPQVAAQAHHHWIVAKEGGAAVTTTVIPLAEKDARREEIARMISGARITDEARAAASSLLEAVPGQDAARKPAAGKSAASKSPVEKTAANKLAASKDRVSA